MKIRDETMVEIDKATKRRIEFEQDSGKSALALVPSDMAIDGEATKVSLKDDKESSFDSKRQRKMDGTSVSNNSAGSAASLEGDRRAQ
jgi:hypothetical protein